MKKKIAAFMLGVALFAPAFTPSAASAQSLWSGSYTQNIFADRKAHDVGDILTIIISETTTTSAAKSSSNSKIGIVSLSGLAVASIVGIAVNAILPGKDYVFQQEDKGATSVDFSV